MARKRRDRDVQPAPESRKQQHLNRREKEQRKLLLSITVPLLVLAAGVLVFGVWRELIQIPNTPVAEVNGERITSSTFSQRINYERRLILNYVNQILPMIQSNDPSVINQLVGGQRTGVAQSTQDKLIDEAIIRQEAAKRGVAVVDADVDQQISGDLATALAPPPTSAPEVTSTPTTTGTVVATATPKGPTASPTATATVAVTPLTTQEVGRQFDEKVQPMLDQLAMSRARYRDIVRQQVFHDRLQKALEADVPTAEKQIDLNYLLFASQQTADEAAAALEKGTSWSEVVAKYGPRPTPAPGAPTFTPEPPAAPPTPAAGTTPGAAGGTPAGSPTPTPEPFATETGGPSWFTRSKLVSDWSLKDPEADAMMALAKGKSSKATQGGRGYYVVQVTDVQDSRPVDETELKTRRDNALKDWLDKRKKELTADNKINRYPLEAFVPPEPAWFSDGFNRLLATPIATLPGGNGIVVSTAPAAESAPVGGTPAAPPPAPPPAGGTPAP